MFRLPATKIALKEAAIALQGKVRVANSVRSFIKRKTILQESSIPFKGAGELSKQKSKLEIK